MTKQDQINREDVERQVNQLLLEGNRLPVGKTLGLIALQQHQTREGHLYTIQVEKNSFFISEHLILKIGQKNYREILFYQLVMERHLPVPSCLVAKREPAGGSTALLCENVSRTHIRLSDWESQPPDPVIQRIVSGLAKIQASGWQHRQIGSLALDLPCVYANRHKHDIFIGCLQHNADGFFQANRQRVSTKAADVYARAVQQLHVQWEHTWAWRRQNCEHLSLVHGDLHPGNIFYPVDNEGNVYYID